jgi:hypothetical protein
MKKGTAPQPASRKGGPPHGPHRSRHRYSCQEAKGNGEIGSQRRRDGIRERWKSVGLAVLATALTTGSAFAQARGRGGRSMLLRMPEVQAELKLTDPES